MNNEWTYDEKQKIYTTPFFGDLAFYLEQVEENWVLGFYDTDHNLPLPEVPITTFYLLEGTPTEEGNKAIAEFLRFEADKFDTEAK